MNTHLRFLTLPDDTPMLLSGIKDFINRMDYHDFLPTTDDALVEAVQRLIGLGAVDILVVEHDKIIVGGIGMLYAPCIWNAEIMIAEELFFWVVSGAPATTALLLLRGARCRARECGCSQLIFKSLTSSPTKLDRVYRSMKLRPVEISYIGPC